MCTSVNDKFVMKAWGVSQNSGDKITLLPDGSAALAKSLGLDLDLTAFGMGLRCKRFAMIIDDCRITLLNVDEGKFSSSSAETILSAL